MASPQTNPRAVSCTEVIGAVAPQRESAWGRYQFRPPALSNTRLIFDPQPFRTHEYIPAKNSRDRRR
jgi:hypothetical protein